MKYAILTPTRDRPQKLLRHLNSINNHVSKNHEVKVYVFVDSDDPKISDYRQQQRELNQRTIQSEYNISVDYTYGNVKSIGVAWNIMAKKALREGAQWLMMGNDDIVYKTKDWDIKLDQHISKLSDDYWLLWPNDGINGGSHCAFPIVSKAWHDTLGYFVPEIFIFGYHDTYVYRVAQRAGRCKYVSDIHNNHQHANRNPKERDATHTQAHRKAGTRQQVFAKDGRTIEKYQSHIEREGDIIKEKIAELSLEK